MRSEYNRQIINDLAPKIKKQGYRVFIADSGTYGFFTDNEGSKVVSFQSDFETTFSGNYKTDRPKETGTGWRIADNDTNDYDGMFKAYPPQWAVHSAKWNYTTLQQHLDMYQKSSKYSEVKD